MSIKDIVIWQELNDLCREWGATLSIEDDEILIEGNDNCKAFLDVTEALSYIKANQNSFRMPYDILVSAPEIDEIFDKFKNHMSQKIKMDVTVSWSMFISNEDGLRHDAFDYSIPDFDQQFLKFEEDNKETVQDLKKSLDDLIDKLGLQDKRKELWDEFLERVCC